ncbi:MAG: hypothetical protein H0U35_06650 [Sporichthyaceae bacterium]|nr:hypothetical protein [Sporichthyaceae bacterium]
MVTASQRTARLALTVGTSLAACLVPALAGAAELRTDDGVGDVWAEVYDDTGTFEGWVKAGTVVNGDVISTKARHASRRIVFTTRYALLVRGAGENRFKTQQQMRFPDGSTAAVVVDTSNGWTGASYVYDADTGNGIPCAGVRHEIDYDADTVRVSFPRACVDRPRWLRYVGLAYAWSGSDTETGDDDHNYLDNALNAGHKQGTGNSNTSPRIYAG